MEPSIRLLTGPKDGSAEASFVKASKESPLGKVYRNNVDKDLIDSDVRNLIELTISTSKTALYYDIDTIKEHQEYTDCQVKVKELLTSMAFL